MFDLLKELCGHLTPLDGLLLVSIIVLIGLIEYAIRRYGE